jgi:hypothetical protein
MGNENEERYTESAAYPTIVNKNDNNKDKIKFVNNENHIYNKEGNDEGNTSLTNAFSNTSLNPFVMAIDMWQNYMNFCNNAYKQLLVNNPPVINGEFLFVYWKSGKGYPKENRSS